MDSKQLYTLIIDNELSRLFVPRTKEELTEIKHQLTYEGLQTTIITWNRIIVDGIDTYKICHDTGIPFRYNKQDFFSKNEVISEICLRELKSPHLTVSRKKYLIGKLGIAQHALVKEGYHFTAGEPTEEEKSAKHRFVLYRWRTQLLLKDIKISQDTVYTYTTYAASIDQIYNKAPSIAAELLNRTMTLSMTNIAKLSELTPLQINTIWKNLNHKLRDTVLLEEIKKQTEVINENKKKRGRKKHEVEIKRMPQYDPDAEFSSLALTLPMWSHSLTRLKTIGKFSEASHEILKKLDHELYQLKTNIDNLHTTIEEELNE